MYRPRRRARRAGNNHGVRYVVIGRLERERFPALDEAGLERLGRVAFAAGDVKIIEVERPAADAGPR